MIALFLLFFTEDHAVTPMNLSLDDPILPIQVVDQAEQAIELNQLFESGLCFFLAPDCHYCESAMTQIAGQLPQKYPCFFIFIDEIPEAYLKNFPSESQTFYKVQIKDLKPYQIATFPALLIYRDQKLIYAFHGPMSSRDVALFGAEFSHQHSKK